MKKFKFKVNDVVIVKKGRFSGLISVIQTRSRLKFPNGLVNEYCVKNLKSRAHSTYQYWFHECMIKKLKADMV